MPSILIIKPDHIGDYILFRNFLLEIKQSEKFFNYKLIVCLNTRVKELAEFLDTNVIDQFIWLDLERFVKMDWYFERKIQEINLNSYDLTINAMFSYMKPIEILISKIKSEKKILIKGSLKERSYIYSENDSTIYSEIIDLSQKQIFEFERFKIAFEHIINKVITIKRPYLEWPNTWQNNLPLKNDFCILFIGADTTYRKWSIYNYIKVVQHILKFYCLDIIILGGHEEIESAEDLYTNFSTNRLVNLVGQTSLLDVLMILKNAKFVISNETGAAHISTILNIPTIVISNGNHFGKFTPYPKEYEMVHYKSIYPFIIDKYKTYIDKYYDGSRLDINLIDFGFVIKTIDLICKEYNIVKQKDINFIKVKNKSNDIISNTQSRLNYDFSSMFSGLYLNLMEIKESNNKIVIYGNGSLGKIVNYIIKTSIVGIIDKNSLNKSIEPNSHDVYSIETLHYMVYDKILITALGRENEIIEYLSKTQNISLDKIVILKISKGRYQLGC